MDRQAARDAVAAFLRAIGHPPDGPLAETPALVTEAWCDELIAGHAQDPAALLEAGTIAAGGSTGLVALRGLQVTTMCPHHLLPAHGTADVLYLPNDHIAGLGAIARAVHALTRRLTLQEDAGSRVAALLVEQLGARGAACRLRMTHTCFIARGEREAGTVVETLALAGSFDGHGPDRELALGALAR